MKALIPFLAIFLFCSQNAKAQTNDQLIRKDKIRTGRQELKNAVSADDPAAAGLWIDSLSRLENRYYVGLSWDERWLLYYWTENYGALFSEAAQLGAAERYSLSEKVQPPADSLFELTDSLMYARRYEAFQAIRHAFLTEEEKAFSILLLEYLLRTNGNEEEWAEKISAFETKYPQSNYLYFLSGVKPDILKPANKAFGAALGLQSGSWTDEIDRSLPPLYALSLDFYYWVDRWNVQFGASFGGGRLKRDITDGLDTWPVNAPASYSNYSLEIGYDIINAEKIRIFPAAGIGIAFLAPPSSSDVPEEIPVYYDSFQLLEGHIGASLTADVKLFRDNYASWDLPKGSYNGFRIRVGYNWLNFGNGIPALDGNLFYFTFGYNVFGYRAAKK